MITGYNTDVRHNDVVYHVQTEDKGLSNPFIESLLYVGGQILANRRTSYAALLAEGKGERAVISLMDHQHRTMIAAIRAGKFDRKLAQLRGDSATPSNGEATAAFAAAAEGSVAVAATIATVELDDSAGTAGAVAGTDNLPGPTIEVAPAAPLALPASPVTRAPKAAPPAAAPASPGAGERTLDQVILDYLTVESQQDQMVLAIENDPEIGLGRHVRLTVRASTSRTAQPLAGVKVAAKLISTISGPQNLAGAETDDNGTAVLELEIPALGHGTAALIVTGSSTLGRTEYKHLL